jgi:hypothetical protein
MAFKADTGEQVLELNTGMGNPGPPMTFMLDGKQYIAIAGSVGGGAGGRGRWSGVVAQVLLRANPGPLPSAARLLLLMVDGKPIPTATPPPAGGVPVVPGGRGQ